MLVSSWSLTIFPFNIYRHYTKSDQLLTINCNCRELPMVVESVMVDEASVCHILDHLVRPLMIEPMCNPAESCNLLEATVCLNQIMSDLDESSTVPKEACSRWVTESSVFTNA